MSAAAALPDLPPQTGPAAAAAPGRFAPLLSLVRKLIDYGKHLAASLQQPVSTANLDELATAFRSYDVSEILARIIRGLHRASALVDKLARLDTCPPTAAASFAPGPRTAASSAPRQQKAAAETALPLTPEQIAAEVRRRPIGEVLADICRDLGILPCHPLWRELQTAMISYHRSFCRLCKDIVTRRWLNPATRQPYAASDPLSPPYQPTPAPAATGPP